MLIRLQPRSHSEEIATKVNLTALAHNYCKLKPNNSELLNVSEVINVIRNLKKDDTVIISRTDKGNGCVILDKSYFLSKMYEIIDGTTKFVKPLLCKYL